MIRLAGGAQLGFLLIAAVSLGAGQNHGSNTVTLDVVVTDKSGAAIRGLEGQDFTLTDNKTSQKITSFRAVERRDPKQEPVKVDLVLDEVNTGFGAVAQERGQISKYFAQEQGELPCPVSLVFFTDAGATMGTNPTQDGKVLTTDLQQKNVPLRTINRAQGFYGAGDRLSLSLRTLEELATYEATQPGRKLVVWVSPGWPLLSGPNVQLTSKDQQAFFNTIVGLSDALSRARITLYAVDPLGTGDAGGFRTFYYEQFVKGVKKPNDVQIGNLALQVLAVQSGGLVLNSSNDVAGEIARSIDDQRSYYELSFDAPAADGRNDYHALQVKVDRPGAVARTRTGYYAQPQ